MHFHLARFNTRQDEESTLILFEQQDRSQWDWQQILIALAYLQQSAHGDVLSRYHVEAGIAAEHCLSPTFQHTNWQKIVTAYQLLERIAPSPFHLLNRAIATAEWKNPEAGLAVLQEIELSSWLDLPYHWYAVTADLQLRNGQARAALKNAQIAFEAAPTEHVIRLLKQRLIKLGLTALELDF